MFIFIEANKHVNVGEVLVVKSDNNGGIGAYLIGGEKIGRLSGDQPAGCVDFKTVVTSLYDNRVLGRAAIVGGDAVIMQTDSKLFAPAQTLKRVEKEGYAYSFIK